MAHGKSCQTCHCGWSSVTTYHGLRTHQGKKGCTPKGMHIPQMIVNSYLPKFTYTPEPSHQFIIRQIREQKKEIVFRGLPSLSEAASNQLFETDLPAINTVQRQALTFEVQPTLPATESTIKSKPLFGTTHQPLQSSDNGSKTRNALDLMIGAQQTSSSQSAATVSDVVMDGKENKPLFGPTTFTFTANASQNTFDQTKQQQPESFNVFSSSSGLSSMDQNFEPALPAFSHFGNNNQTQGTFGWRSGLQQFPVPKPGPFNIPAAAQNTTQVDKPSTGLLENLLISDVPAQVSTSGPSLFAAEAMENQLQFGRPQQQQFPFAQTQPQSFSGGAQEMIFQTPSPSQKGPKTSEEKPKTEFGRPQQQQFPFAQTQPQSFSGGAQEMIFQTPSPSQTGPKTSEEKPKTESTIPPSTSRNPAAPQNGQRDSQSGPVTPKAAHRQEHKSYFQTPQQNSHQAPAEGNNARRALDFSTGGQQAQTSLAVPTTTHQTTLPSAVDENEAEKLRQIERYKIKGELQLKIRSREQKLSEIRSCVKSCKGSLDEEWLEIDAVFSNVIHIVEEARERALRPLADRREKLKKDSQSLIQKIQEEIDKLKTAIEEVDNAADLDIVPLPKQRFKDFAKSKVNTTYTFGTLRTTISTVTEQIQKELDKLSALELQRAPAFAVDVKLDPGTAHQWLLVSKDGKKVQDGGQSQQLPHSAGRFDSFGSILGGTHFSSGRAYWEVQVGGKIGWDLGVASAQANRKGELKLSPENGYWAMVHYEGDKYAALAVPPVCVRLKRKPQKVGVFLDYDEGLVSFYNVTDQTHIYSFTECSFDDGVLPYFSPHLKLNGKNAEPLIISKVQY